MLTKEAICPICGNESVHYTTLSNEEVSQKKYDYFKCKHCKSLFINPEIIDHMDSGNKLVSYNENYWQIELEAARERCFGVALARMSEAIFFTRIPVKRFLDIGAGTGYFLDAIKRYLPNKEDTFYAVEKFPPKIKERTTAKNYYTCEYKEVGEKFDCGMCIEVIEHLTPKMLKGLFQEVAEVSNNGALYIINSGMPEFVEHEDPKYLDPFVRGHIVSYSLKAMKILLENLGFSVHGIRGKSWAFAIEYGDIVDEQDITDRIWSILPENLELLKDEKMGTVMQILGRESVRAYL